jgi:dTDP-4-amino-4,6-dideoxygalactose transaminase
MSVVRRAEFLPFAQPTIHESDVEAVAEVVRSGWLTSGPRIQKFESEFAGEVGAGAAVAVSSGTAAMHVALTALRPPAGSSVITSPMTFCSTAHVIEHVGCRPLFVDVEPDTLNINPEGIRRALEDERHSVSAILPVHYAGHPAELEPILALARTHNLPVLEDAAHAFGASYRGTPIGQVDADEHNRAVAFSLYATKNITSGEGGMLTGSEALVERARSWSLHGLDRSSWSRYGPGGSWRYEVLEPGFKYNMSDILAALGLSQLSRWRGLQRRRTDLAARYTRLLADVDEVDTPQPRRHVTPAWHLYPIRLRLSALTIDRAEFIEELRGRNIGTSVHFIPVHIQPYYQQRYGFAPGDFPVTMTEFERLISLPLYPRMTDADVDDVVAAIRDTVAAHRRVR